MPGRLENFGFWLSKTFATSENKNQQWPYVPGKYFVNDANAPVAVTTLGSVKFAEEISKAPSDQLCIVGKVETENIGIEKIMKNIISNPSIRFLLMVGKESPKHLPGATFKALLKNGINENRRIIGSPGMRPVLPNTTAGEVHRFADQIELVDMIDCMEVDKVSEKVEELASVSPGLYKAPALSEEINPVITPTVAAVYHDPKKIKLDKAGYFVIYIENSEILVEHYSNKEKLLRVITGDNARDIYLTIVDNGWVSQLDHAGYLGKELAKAELSIEHNFEYLQDHA
jgi:tetrahydromethanopterin S-methyltransferase subunit A